MRDKILCAAKDLFGEKGYNNVSMRNIAEALGISVGNLTYYYKKKEDLIEAVILDQHKEYKEPEVPVSLMDIHLFFQRIMEHQKNNAYYFRHYTQLADICPKIYELQKQVKRDKFEVLRKGMKILVQKGYFRPESIDGQYESVIQVLMTVSIYWRPGVSILFEENESRGMMHCIWSVLYPLLTQKGVAVFRSEIEATI